MDASLSYTLTDARHLRRLVQKLTKRESISLAKQRAAYVIRRLPYLRWLLLQPLLEGTALRHAFLGCVVD